MPASTHSPDAPPHPYRDHDPTRPPLAPYPPWDPRLLVSADQLDQIVTDFYEHHTPITEVAERNGLGLVKLEAILTSPDALERVAIIRRLSTLRVRGALEILLPRAIDRLAVIIDDDQAPPETRRKAASTLLRLHQRHLRDSGCHGLAAPGKAMSDGSTSSGCHGLDALGKAMSDDPTSSGRYGLAVPGKAMSDDSSSPGCHGLDVLGKAMSDSPSPLRSEPRGSPRAGHSPRQTNTPTDAEPSNSGAGCHGLDALGKAMSDSPPPLRSEPRGSPRADSDSEAAKRSRPVAGGASPRNPPEESPSPRSAEGSAPHSDNPPPPPPRGGETNTPPPGGSRPRLHACATPWREPSTPPPASPSQPSVPSVFHSDSEPPPQRVLDFADFAIDSYSSA